MLKHGMHIHLVGIGGFGLSAIARVLLGHGYVVSGSDRAVSPLTGALAAEGARVAIGHAAENIAGADLLLISSAIPADNPEVRAALAANIPVVKRAEFIGQLMAGRTGLAVAGTHGKTTTTAMLASILLAAELDPSFIVGGVLTDLNSNARAGQGEHFVIEADEYDRMFLGLAPRAALVTMVEHDHPDCFPTFDDVLSAFRAFIGRLPADGLLVACQDDPGARLLGEEHEAAGGAVRWYGLSPDALWRATDLQPNQAGGTDFVAVHGSETIGLVRLRLPGRHNVLNALGAIALADWLQVPFNTTRQGLRDLSGIGRRFELKGCARDVVVVDDYAHHPTEIAATLAAARDRYPERRIWALFQPHTYSRTRTLLDQYATAFGAADEVVVLDIYAAREAADPAISAPLLASRIEHPRARHVGDLRQTADFMIAHLLSGDLLLTLGAGDGYLVGEWVLAALQEDA